MPSSELEDYRAFRVEPRLANAQRYLEKHPRGAYAAEVRAYFEREEARWFAEARASSERAMAYLTELPRGPHAAEVLEAAVALEAVSKEREVERLVREARRRDAYLEAKAAGRQRVRERIFELLAALLDENVYGAYIESLPPPLARVMAQPRTPITWGGVALRRADDLFFTIPTAEGAESRLVTVEILLALERGRVAEGRIEGEDLFVRWAEADLVDPSKASDHVRERLDGALEARLPGAECRASAQGGEILRRSCGGWSAYAIQGKKLGDRDVVVVRGPMR
jgi:hypothetical protein